MNDFTKIVLLIETLVRFTVFLTEKFQEIPGKIKHFQKFIGLFPLKNCELYERPDNQ